MSTPDATSPPTTNASQNDIRALEPSRTPLTTIAAKAESPEAPSVAGAVSGGTGTASSIAVGPAPEGSGNQDPPSGPSAVGPGSSGEEASGRPEAMTVGSPSHAPMAGAPSSGKYPAGALTVPGDGMSVSAVGASAAVPEEHQLVTADASRLVVATGRHAEAPLRRPIGQLSVGLALLGMPVLRRRRHSPNG